MTAARIVTAGNVQDAVLATLMTHLPPVLAVMGDLEMPKSHKAPTVDAAKIDAAALPILLVAVPGFADTPDRDEQGIYTGRFDCLIDFIIRSREGTYEATARDVRNYAAAIRTVLIERTTLDGYALDVLVDDEKYDDADPKAARTLAQGEVSCVVTVFDTNRTGTTFTDPDSAPVTATSTTVTIEPLEGATNG